MALTMNSLMDIWMRCFRYLYWLGGVLNVGFSPPLFFSFLFPLFPSFAHDTLKRRRKNLKKLNRLKEYCRQDIISLFWKLKKVQGS